MSCSRNVLVSDAVGHVPGHSDVKRSGRVCSTPGHCSLLVTAAALGAVATVHVPHGNLMCGHLSPLSRIGDP